MSGEEQPVNAEPEIETKTDYEPAKANDAAIDETAHSKSSRNESTKLTETVNDETTENDSTKPDSIPSSNQSAKVTNSVNDELSKNENTTPDCKPSSNQSANVTNSVNDELNKNDNTTPDCKPSSNQSAKVTNSVNEKLNKNDNTTPDCKPSSNQSAKVTNSVNNELNKNDNTTPDCKPSSNQSAKLTNSVNDELNKNDNTTPDCKPSSNQSAKVTNSVNDELSKNDNTTPDCKPSSNQSEEVSDIAKDNITKDDNPTTDSKPSNNESEQLTSTTTSETPKGINSLNSSKTVLSTNTTDDSEMDNTIDLTSTINEENGSIKDNKSITDNLKKDESMEVDQTESEEECKVLHIKSFPAKWTFHKIKQYIVDQVTNQDFSKKFFYIIMMKNQAGEQTGEVLIKFGTAQDAKTVETVLNRRTGKLKQLTIQYDVGNVLMKQMKTKTKAKSSSENTVLDKYEFIKKKHETIVALEAKLAKNDEDSGEPEAKKIKTDVAEVQKTVKPAKKPFVPIRFMNERLTNDTYGLRTSFLSSLNLWPPLKNRIVVSKLDDRVDEAKLREVFSMAGQIVRINFEHRSGSSKNKAVIEFDHPVEAVQAIAMFRGKLLYDRPIVVYIDQRQKQMPEGLSDVGFGLGHEGEPLRGVRIMVEMQKVKDICMKMGSYNDDEAGNRSQFNNSLNFDVNSFQPSNQFTAPSANPTPNALGAVNQPNLLMMLNTLLSAQGLVQQGTGNDLTSLLTTLQNQLTPNAGQSMPQNVPNVNQNVTPANPNVAQQYNQPPRHGVPNIPHIRPSAPPLRPNAPNFQQHAPNFQQNAPSFQQHVPGFHQNAPSFQQNAPSFQQNAPSFQQNAPSFRQNDPGFHQNAPNYMQKFTPNAPSASVSDWKSETQPNVKSSYSSDSSRYYIDLSKNDEGIQRGFDSKRNKDPAPETRRKDEDGERKSDMLIFTNLPPSVTAQALNSKMKEVGNLMFGELTGNGRAVVRFTNVADAERCIKLFNRSKVDGQMILVKYL